MTEQIDTIDAVEVDTETGEVYSPERGLVSHSDSPIADYGMPALQLEQAKKRYQALKEFIGACLQNGRDYGEPFPGSDKPSLLKPGAEKLTTFFGLTTEFDLVEKVEDWTGEEHGGYPLFSYTYRCTLSRCGVKVCDAVGMCSSWESKYRYRKGERTCPACGSAAIIKGKAEYGGGWLCFAKKGGCGAKFADGDKSIESQQTGRVLNDDPADQINTVMKIATKRAYMAAVLIGCNASDYFTQDGDDFTEPPRGGGNAVPEPGPGTSKRSARGTSLPKGGGHTQPAPEPTGQDEPEWAGVYPDLRQDTQMMLYRAKAFGATWKQVEAMLKKPLDRFTEEDVTEINKRMDKQAGEKAA